MVRQIQPSFAGGELAPALWARIDLQKYGVGARKLRNFLVHPHGGASNRPGTYFLAAAKHGAKNAASFLLNSIPCRPTCWSSAINTSGSTRKADR